MTFDLKLLYLPTLLAAAAGVATVLFLAPKAVASGMTPDAPVVIIDEGTGEASINITNTTQYPSLLVSTIKKLTGDDEDIVFLTPPIARVEPGDTQLVRFILQSDTPLSTQRLRRVTFQGVPSQIQSATPQVNITLSQNLPVVINPKGLKKDLTPWTHIKWTMADDKLTATNPSPYVVRLASEVGLKPGSDTVLLPHTYILPGQILVMDVPAGHKAERVKIEPTNLYGYAVGDVIAPIHRVQPR